MFLRPILSGTAALPFKVQCYQKSRAKATHAVGWLKSLLTRNQPKRKQSQMPPQVSLIGLVGCALRTLFWFPAHWAPMVTKTIHNREQKFTRTSALVWWSGSSPDLHGSQQEVQDSRSMKSKLAPFSTRSLYGCRTDWDRLTCPACLEHSRTVGLTMKNENQQRKAPEQQKVSMLLPDESALEGWYESVCRIPMSWPDIASFETDYMKRTHSTDLHVVRKQVRARCLWKGLDPHSFPSAGCWMCEGWGTWCEKMSLRPWALHHERNGLRVEWPDSVVSPFSHLVAWTLLFCLLEHLGFVTICWRRPTESRSFSFHHFTNFCIGEASLVCLGCCVCCLSLWVFVVLCLFVCLFALMCWPYQSLTGGS